MADSFTPMLTDRVIQIVAENKIQATIQAGEFDNLPGLGKPAAIFDEPYDPFWWIRRKLKSESLTAVIQSSQPQRHGEHGENKMTDDQIPMNKIGF